MKFSDDFLSQIDIITPNETESETLTGISIKNINDAKSVVQFLNNKGVKQVIITSGANALFITEAAKSFINLEKS